MADIVTAYVFPGIGVGISCALFGSSALSVWRAFQSRNIEAIDSPTLAMQFINTLMWMRYGVIKDDIFVWVSNAPGSLITGFYMGVVFFLCGHKGDMRTLRLIAGILALGLVYLMLDISVIAFANVDKSVTNLMAGFSTNIWLGGMYLAPIMNVIRAFREGNADFIYFPLVIVTLLNGGLWFGYGLGGANDPFIYVPNGIGMVAAIVQIVTVLIFCGKRCASKGQAASDTPVPGADLHSISTFPLQADESKSLCLSFSELPDDLSYSPTIDSFRGAEALHGRWAMLSALGVVTPELLSSNSVPFSGGAVWSMQSIQLVSRVALNYLGNDRLIHAQSVGLTFLSALSIAHAVESSKREEVRELQRYSGDKHAAFDHRSVAVALVAMLGSHIYPLVDKAGSVENLVFHLADSSKNNIFSFPSSHH
eukprot:EG_transcript_11551